MAMAGTTSINDFSTGSPSTSFQRAVDKFTRSLTPKQRQEFDGCSLDDVRQTVVTVQEKRGSQKTMRNMARLEAFLEAMEQYGKVVEAFLNCTPFLGYVWVRHPVRINPFEMLTSQGPIRFILLVRTSRTSSRICNHEL
jgi:hypothetical protein